MGFSIVYPKLDYYKFGDTIELNFHLGDQNNTPITNWTAGCVIDVYNMTGEHILVQEPLNPQNGGADFYIRLDRSNITKPGYYYYDLFCMYAPETQQPPYYRQFISTGFKVTRTGEDNTPATRQGITVFLGLVLIAAFYIGIGVITKKAVPKFFSFSMAGIQALLGAFIIYSIELGNPISSLLYMNFWIYLITLFGIGMITFFLYARELASPDIPEEEENKWSRGK